MNKSHLLISAPSSNSGKTTLTLGLLRALKNRGLQVQPFKCGPDYIDPVHHTIAAGKQSINLDTFMSTEVAVQQLYAQYNADVSVTEGVMGLFDGADRMEGSSAAIAQLLDIPVVLVVNAKSMAYSAAPLLYGFKNFYPGVRVVGVIFNFVNSESHYRLLQEACEDVGLEALGYLPENKNLRIPSRHLGLHISGETDYEQIIGQAAELIEKYIDLDRLLEITQCHRGTSTSHPSRVTAEGKKLRIAVARDEAFAFRYHQNIAALNDFGDITWFSPLHDSVLPDTDFLYLPGGYPELYAKELSENVSMLESIRTYCRRGGLTYAECGGLMYLGKRLITEADEEFSMVGIFDFNTSMVNRKMTLGYRIATWENMEFRGHEFHYSNFSHNSETALDIRVIGAKGVEVDTQFFRKWNTFATYMHAYWGGDSRLITKLIEQKSDCRQPKADSHI